MSSKELPLVSRVLLEAGGHWSDTVIWAKDRFVLGRADYQRAYEPVWYGWREGAKRTWNGGRDQDDVWHIDRPGASPLHPTMKPLPLIERALQNSSKPGALVLDPFLGSGSTLIACERSGRVGAGIELDPRYCDVAVARWETFTGLTAELADAPASVSPFRRRPWLGTAAWLQTATTPIRRQTSFTTRNRVHPPSRGHTDEVRKRHAITTNTGSHQDRPSHGLRDGRDHRARSRVRR